MDYWIILLAAIIFAAFFLIPRASWVSVKDAKALIESGALLFDVRSPSEYDAGSANGAVNVPLGELEKKMQSLTLPKDAVIILYCASGTRSAFASRKLKDLGYANTFNVGTLSRARQLV